MSDENQSMPAYDSPQNDPEPDDPGHIASFSINGKTLAQIMKIKDEGKRKATMAAYQAALDAYMTTKAGGEATPKVYTEKPTTVSAPKTQSPKVVQLPVWADAVRGVPNVALRSALFGVVKRGKRAYLERETIHAQSGVIIRYTGMRLDQADLDVWEQCLHLARARPLEMRVVFSGHGFLKAIGRNTSGANSEWLKGVFSRLQATSVEMDDGQGHAYAGPLILHWARDENTGFHVIELNPQIAGLYGQDGWTGIAWDQRLNLKQNQLAKWLHGFYASHAHPYPVKVTTLRAMSGSESEALFHFRDKLREALTIVAKSTGWTWKIDKNDLVHIDKTESVNRDGGT
jgi:hypothetical protein